MNMMREGKATVYAGPPTWDPIEILRGYKFSAPRLFLVGRCLPGVELMAVAWLQPDGRWTHDKFGIQMVEWDPLYFAEAPAWPVWPPPDHHAFVAHEAEPNVL